MASIRKRGGTYQIRVSAGYDINRKQIIKTKTWKPLPEWSEKRIEKELNKATVQFENDVLTGHYVDGSVRFGEFAERWLREYGSQNLRPKSILRYQNLLDRIVPAIGHIKLEQLQPLHLVAFYNNLSEEGVKNAESSRPKTDLDAIRRTQGLSKAELARRAGVSYSVAVNACKGLNIRHDGAGRIAETLGLSYKSTFEDIGKTEKLASGTIAQHHRLISDIMETAVRWGLVLDNPCRRVTPPRTAHKRRVALSSEETLELFQCLSGAPEKYKTAVTVLLYSGLRKGELCGLKWDDISFENGVLTVNRTLSYYPRKGLFEDEPKTENGKRAIKLPKPALAALREHRKRQTEERLAVGDRWNDTGFIFTKWDGTPMHPDSLYQWFTKFVRQNGLPPVTLHSLRHTNASLLIANKIDIATVSKRLGHADTSITARVYTHAIKEADAVAADALENILLQRTGNGTAN